VAVLNERINSPGWATYLRVSDEDKQTPERSFAMQRQRIEDEFSTKNTEECGSEQPLGEAQNQKDGNYQTVFLLINRAGFTSTKRNTLLNDVAHHPF